MLAIKARFDGKRVVLPEAPKVPVGNVILLFEELDANLDENGDWLAAEQTSFSKVWDNDEDAIYDDM